MTTATFLLLGVALIVVGFAVVGHLGRIADAIEAQNRAYGITGEPADEEVEAA